MSSFVKINLKFLVAFGLAVVVMSSGCATIVKSPVQEVQIIGAKKGMSMATKYKNMTLATGQNSVMLKRSVNDIEVSLKCTPQSKPKKIYLMTRPGGWFLFGNFMLLGGMGSGVVGYIIDYITQEGWNIDSPVSVAQYCDDSD